MRTLSALARACHPAPTVVVTALGVLLAVDAGLDGGTTVLVGLAVLTGQLSVGWSNDLLDARRDRTAGRTDKPVAAGELSARVIIVALGAVVVLCAVLSLALGPPAAAAHLVLLVSAWAYNLGLKATVVSWLPYVVAFAALPAVPSLALAPPVLPPTWMMAVGALLGAGAHLVNALPDLADDAATGVRGLPHRLGARGAGVLAVAVLAAGTAVAVLGPTGPVPWWGWLVLGLAVTLAALGLHRAGRAPFGAAMAIALLNVVMLLVRGA